MKKQLTFVFLLTLALSAFSASLALDTGAPQSSAQKVVRIRPGERGDDGRPGESVLDSVLDAMRRIEAAERQGTNVCVMVEPTVRTPSLTAEERARRDQIDRTLWRYVSCRLHPHAEAKAKGIRPGNLVWLGKGETLAGPRAATPAVKDYWLMGRWDRRVPRLKEKRQAMLANADREYDVVLLGDSITHFFERGQTYADAFRGLKVMNLGFAGDHTENTLWNVLYGGFLDGVRVKVFTLLIGTNNRGDSAEDTALGIRRILDALAAKQPESRVILLPIFPRYDPASPERARNERVNALIRPYADGERVHWLDFNSRLVNADGTVSKDILCDLVHPSRRGYEIWVEEMMPVVRKLLARHN